MEIYMARPQRCRRVCCEPQYTCFVPSETRISDQIYLTVDEYEVIRLVDLEKLSHKQCSNIMEISRTTVTEIYEKARYKLANAIVNGKKLEILGGNYRICDEHPHSSCKKICRKKRIHKTFAKDHLLKIAVPYDRGEIFQHFGHTKQFKIYEVLNKKIIRTEIIETLGFGHETMTQLLVDHGIEVLICGCIGNKAQKALEDLNIELYDRFSNKTDEAVQELIEGKL